MKIAIVTGASSGMGREMVYHLADRFGGLSEIWVIARRKDRLEEFQGRVPVRIRTFEMDIMESESLKTLKNALEVEKPDVRVLVNAAGCGKQGMIGAIPEQEVSRMIRLNNEALTMMTETVLPYIGEGGKVMQFASAAAFIPQPGFAVYAATKAYVLSYSRALAAELKPRNITVTAVCPGPVDTEFLDHALDGKEQNQWKKLATMKPKPVAAAAVSDCLKGKEVSIPGLPMKAFHILCKVVPYDMLVNYMK